MSTAPPEPTEEEIRAYEEQLSRITSTEIALQATASLLNVGGRRLGLSQGTEQQRDLDQVRDAIDGARALLPIVERSMPAAQVRPLRDALSQLQMAYARLVQASPKGAEAAAGAQPAGASGGAAGTGAESHGAEGEPQPAAGQAGGEGAPPAADRPAGGAAQKQPGPAESSGRLWVPGR